jgi:hypothetical protein
MAANQNLTFFLIGLAIGGGSALLGGLVEYVLHLRRRGQPRPEAPGCLLYAAGGLVLTGIAALIVSLLATGGVGPALVMGAGVMTGFYSGFILLVGVYFLIDAIRPTVDEPTPSDSLIP